MAHELHEWRHCGAENVPPAGSGDESKVLTHPYLAHAWAKKAADLRIPAPGQATKVAMLGVFDWARHDLVVHTSRTKHSADFIALPRIGIDNMPGDFEYVKIVG